MLNSHVFERNALVPHAMCAILESGIPAFFVMPFVHVPTLSTSPGAARPAAPEPALPPPPRGICFGRSPAAQQAFAAARRAARVDSTVVLQGETGAGKDVLARLIHEWSDRAAGPFVTLCCAEFPDGLLHGELFGHEAGAFTGALGRRVGRFERAHGGTLYLDEVGEIEPAVQLSLLRVLECGRFDRLGGGETQQADFRLVCATHVDLAAQVREGTFREDLYYRLQVLGIRVPPLRERPEDVLPLAAFFLRRCCERMERPALSWSQEAEDALLRRAWPGNVRELANVIERAAVQARGPRIEAADLASPVEPAPPPPSASGELSWEEEQREILRRTMLRCRGNRHEAARQLAMPRSSLIGKLRRWGLEEVGREAPPGR